MNFEHTISNDEKILQQGNYPVGATVHNETYVEYEENGQTIKQTIGASGGPLYSEKGESINSFINTYGNLFFNYFFYQKYNLILYY